MTVSDSDRAHMARLARDLADIETDDEPSPERRAAIIEWVNKSRRRAGIPPLTEEDDPPEEEFYRRARALGMAGARRRGT